MTSGKTEGVRRGHKKARFVGNRGGGLAVLYWGNQFSPFIGVLSITSSDGNNSTCSPLFVP